MYWRRVLSKCDVHSEHAACGAECRFGGKRKRVEHRPTYANDHVDGAHSAASRVLLWCGCVKREQVNGESTGHHVGYQS